MVAPSEPMVGNASPSPVTHEEETMYREERYVQESERLGVRLTSHPSPACFYRSQSSSTKRVGCYKILGHKLVCQPEDFSIASRIGPLATFMSCSSESRWARRSMVFAYTRGQVCASSSKVLSRNDRDLYPTAWVALAVSRLLRDLKAKTLNPRLTHRRTCARLSGHS